VAICVDASKTLGRDAFRGVVDYIRKTGCEWLLHGAAGNRLWLPIEVDRLPLKDLDGVISFSSDKAVYKKIKKTRVQYVSFFDETLLPSVPSVVSDNKVIGQLAAEHFAGLTIKRFVYYGTDLARNSKTRFNGFKEVLENKIGRGFQVGRDGSARRNEEDVFRPVHLNAGMADLMPASQEERKSSLCRLGDELLKLSDGGRECLGVFTYNDSMGVTVIEACRAVGLAVPDKVAVIAVATDEIICELSRPSLTAIQQNAERIGWEAASMLDSLLNHRRPENRCIIVPPSGIKVRQSTDIIAVDDPYVLKAVRIIRERFRAKLNVNEICTDLNVSRSELEKRFRKALGRAPYEEIIRARIRYAETLLAETEGTNLTVAMASGFANGRRFEENFRKLNGMSPGQFRKKSAGRQDGGEEAR